MIGAEGSRRDITREGVGGVERTGRINQVGEIAGELAKASHDQHEQDEDVDEDLLRRHFCGGGRGRRERGRKKKAREDTG